MRSLSTKLTKTYDIDIPLIWMPLQGILSSFAGIFTVKMYKYLIYTISLILSRLYQDLSFVKQGVIILEIKYASVHLSVNN